MSGPPGGILGTGSLTPPAGVADAAAADALDVVAGSAPRGGPPAAAPRRRTPRPALTSSRRCALRGAHSSWPPLRAVDMPPDAPDGEATSLLRPVPAEPAAQAAPGRADAPESSPRPERAPDVPLAGPRSRRAGGSRRSSGSTAALSAVPAPATGRAGRNLPAAIGVGLGLGGVVLASLLWRKEAFVVLVALAVVTALWELTAALAKKSINVPVCPPGGRRRRDARLGLPAGEDGLLVSFTLTAFGVLLWRIIDGTQGAARDVAAAVFVAAYVPFLAGFATLMLAADDGAYRVIVFILVTVANDVGGYAAGVLFGRHPMSPSISPKKSWEGLAGSFLLCMVVGASSVHFLLNGRCSRGWPSARPPPSPRPWATSANRC